MQPLLIDHIALCNVALSNIHRSLYNGKILTGRRQRDDYNLVDINSVYVICELIPKYSMIHQTSYNKA